MEYILVFGLLVKAFEHGLLDTIFRQNIVYLSKQLIDSQIIAVAVLVGTINIRHGECQGC